MTVHVFETMGTTVSLRYPGGMIEPTALATVEAVFADDDKRFSLYDPSSPLSRIARGQATLARAEEPIRDAYALAVEWRNRTAGAFTPHRPDGVVDLSGVVKALAMRRAGEVLDECCGDWILAVGGDVLSRGTYRGAAWRIGVVDPDARDRLAGLIEPTGARRAVATSGTAERGQHIWRRSSGPFEQVTVSADDIVTADVLATAIVAGDEADLDRITAEFDVDVMAFGADSSCRATPGARAWVGSEKR